jgi:uncharacterized SAM-binding protein YcdF (DUF218 family)
MLTFVLFVLLVTVVIGILWIALVIQGRQFAIRDRLQKADAIIVLAGTRGNIKFLQGKIFTAVRLYQAQAVLVEQEALRTRENAEYMLRLLKQHQMRSIILVTSPFHQRGACWLPLT